MINPARLLTVLSALALFALLLSWRAFDLQVMNNDFLQGQGDARSLRVIKMAAHRGMISDRYNEPLAVSTPVDSVWANPHEISISAVQLSRLAGLLHTDVSQLRQRLDQHDEREFVYLRRHIDPDTGLRVMKLQIPGIALQREYRRYYPAGEVAAHLVGFTNIDDRGQEGIELAYDDWLRGKEGNKRVIRDRLGRIVEDVESIVEPMPGKDLHLSIDRRLQYLTYRELKTAVKQNRARSGSAVMLDVASGEVLAIVNLPSYNPNNRSTIRQDALRNRAVTDVFEPGSTIKPFTVAAALETGKYHPGTLIHTAPGMYRVGNKSVRDHRNYGDIDVATVLQKSSNVGASKIALNIPAEQLWNVFSRLGFGLDTGSGFPGESGGMLTNYQDWNDVERATLSYGYGISVTALQLARAYMVLASGGELKPVSFVALDKVPQSQRVVAKQTAHDLVSMLEKVTHQGGTGVLAQVPGYRIAGKTGTVQKYSSAGYSDERYVSLFAGMAPASQPRLVLVVMINEPGNDEYYGGRIAAPVFSRVMAGALRILGVPPDAPQELQLHTASWQSTGQQHDGASL